MTIAGMDAWLRALAVFTTRYAWIIARQPAGDATRIAARVAEAHAVVAYTRGATIVEHAARATGAPAAGITPPSPATMTTAIRHQVAAGWDLARRAPAPEAARAATVRRALTMSSALAWRQGTGDQVVENPEVTGWRRVANSAACAVCLALDDGAIHSDDTLFPSHNGCVCGMEPITTYADPPRMVTGQERFDRMTADEQDRLLYGRGGTKLADKIRSGDISLADLVTRYPRRPGEPPVVGQAPLKSFT